jgi:hypothetical protein
MKFGGKQTMADKMASVEDRYGKTLGASKGYTPPPKAKIKPKGNPLKGKIGFTYTQMLRGGMK